jgi:hypothetical protein
MDNENQSSLELEQLPPAPPSAFSVFTHAIIELFFIAAVRGGFVYVVWNWCLSKELHLQEFSYAFCFCIFIFFQALFFSSDTRRICLQLMNLQTTLDQLYKLTMFNVTREVIKDKQEIVKKENSAKVTDENA